MLMSKLLFLNLGALPKVVYATTSSLLVEKRQSKKGESRNEDIVEKELGKEAKKDEDKEVTSSYNFLFSRW